MLYLKDGNGALCFPHPCWFFFAFFALLALCHNVHASPSLHRPLPGCMGLAGHFSMKSPYCQSAVLACACEHLSPPSLIVLCSSQACAVCLLTHELRQRQHCFFCKRGWTSKWRLQLRLTWECICCGLASHRDAFAPTLCQRLNEVVAVWDDTAWEGSHLGYQAVHLG